MNTAFYKTESAIFEFSQNDIKEHIKLLTKEHEIEELSKLYVLLDLIAAGKGSILCKVCGKKYKSNQLKPIIVGHGKSPFNVNPGMKGGDKSLYVKKRRIPLFGGHGYECPKEHILLEAITWRT